MLNTFAAELHALQAAATVLERGFTDLPDFTPHYGGDGIGEVLREVAERLQDNYPYHHPLYAGQMLKPPHPLARAAYALTMLINPNNHALDGGRASSAMEKEAVAELAALFGWQSHLGHLTGGGTMANLEALWVAGEMRPGETVLASEQAHYTHGRISAVLKLPFEALPADRYGRMDAMALEERLRRGGVGTVVATVGTTGAGALDPVHRIVELKEQYGFRLHIDAAYGGYFALADNLMPQARQVFTAMTAADSIVVDPHKHGLQPYGCGCVLFRDPEVGRFYLHDSGYTYFTSRELHLGEISLECSRAGAAAVALWATQKLLPLRPGGAFARGLSLSREAACGLHDWLEESPAYLVLFPPELDIVLWAPQARTATSISAQSRVIFERAARSGLHLALARLPRHMLAPHWSDVRFDEDTVLCLRSCLMKPEHAAWMGDVVRILAACGDDAQ